MRIIGLDIHRVFAEAVAWEDGKLRRIGRVDIRRDHLEKFACSLSPEDIVVVEATGNASAVSAVIAPHVKRMAIANPKQVKIIAHAKIKTDTIDAGVLAQLYASGFLPEVWVPDEATQALRRQVSRRQQIVKQRSRLKNIIQSILHAHLIPPCPAADLCGTKGRGWLSGQRLPEDERLAINRHLREFDRLGDDLKVIERDLAQSALEDGRAKRIMTIPGIDMIVALAIVAAIGDAGRFETATWPHHQAGTRPCPRHAGRGRLGGGAGARTASRLLFARALQARPACRGCRNRKENGGPHLASLAKRRKLRLGQACSLREKTSRPRIESGLQAEPRSEGSRQRLQQQKSP